ncbi:uncharacterized protein MYCFIDRAFT_211122 [Pseudocercospora fijiensis CIRAD86]|uniref:Uncharacterized protein n=1 Tax=Pseudocercospora fijiensis (strain CIRAD86) TaxID=383855 RepID=M3AZT5_PSEFD|nr:uncharacterized protein MYCFIDRAFT_211122 [Pseudocercospora fijiensis CIRAD86]EME82678.1 hypothetical protein MYCFIDRAFT_211122 [Pseudocercospora fijiensis CIRAD86]
MSAPRRESRYLSLGPVTGPLWAEPASPTSSSSQRSPSPPETIEAVNKSTRSGSQSSTSSERLKFLSNVDKPQE